MGTVLAVERHPVHPDQIASYESLLSDHLGSMRQASGVLWADAARAFDDDPSFVVLSEWRTAGDLDAWESGPHHRAFTEQADPLVREAPTRRRFSPSG